MVKLLLSGCSTILLALSVLAAPALAAGGGGSGGSGGGGDGGTAGCPTGQVYDDAKNKCVPKSSSLVRKASPFEYVTDGTITPQPIRQSRRQGGSDVIVV